MKNSSIFSNLVRADDGTFCTSYANLFIRSALQPIFRRTPAGELIIDSFEGLVRATRDSDPLAPGAFFAAIPPEDMGLIDSMLRTIHILNTGRLNRPGTHIFVNFTPGLYRTEQDVKQEVERIRLATREAGMIPGQIVCEISEKANGGAELPHRLVGQLKEGGFRIAVDDYGAGDSDIERVRQLQPNYVKFEANWVRDFMTNSAGAALLGVIVKRFEESGIQTVFEGLESDWQVELCQELGVPLMQGYALARPELAPTTFNERFPLAPHEPALHGENPHAFTQGATPRLPRNDGVFSRSVRAFGKRGTT